jgi:hypothetical protein
LLRSKYKTTPETIMLYSTTGNYKDKLPWRLKGKDGTI